MDRLAVQVQNARTIASGAEIVHGSVAIVATPKVQREEGEAVGDRVVGHLLQGVARDAMHGGARA